MATKLWDQEIDKTVDWGNADGLGTPVSGKYVQKFIKDTLAKKFGHLYYDRSALKYYVFADVEDYNTWDEDGPEHLSTESLVLATFDAPAPADISIISKSDDSVTTLLTASNRKIEFNYYIVDKSNNAVAENVSLRAVIARSGEQQSFTDNIAIDREHYNDKEVGTHYSFNLDSYLVNEGTYTITITLTGLNTQASTTLTFFYTVVNLDLSLSTFEYYKPFNSNDSIFQVPVTSTGAAGIMKTIDIFVDGEPLIQTGLGYNEAVSSGDGFTANGSYTTSLKLYNKDFEGNIVKWSDSIDTLELRNKAVFAPGKHTLQLRTSIPGDSEPFYSKTKYFEFVVIDESAVSVNETFLLYVADAEAGVKFDSSKPIEISGQQYDGVSLNVAAIDNQNRTVPVKYEISGRNSGFTATIEKTIDNQSIDVFTYRFDDSDVYDLTVSIDKASFSTTTNDEIHAVITIEPFALAGETIKESLSSNLLVKYAAINRGNGETNKDVWINSSSSDYARSHPFQAIFSDKILWNEQSGWDGEALVLKNGATVEFPIDLFNEMWGQFGLTFEIDFETFDVQDDDAMIMDFSDPSLSNNSYIKITATSASLNTNRNIFLKTNFKDSTRNKIAFSFNPTTVVENGVSQGEGNPNLLMIYVNGVLDRAGKWGNGTANSDSITWGEHTTTSIKIGNPDGAASVKIYSIRIYDTALIPEEAFMNYVVDQGKNIPAIISKNHVLENGVVSLDLVKAMIPTLVISTDFDAMNNETNKKNNRTFDAQYYDPTDPSLNFYVRNGWLSCQGTSSMQYPTKNLRPYFNKTANDKTFAFGIATSEQASRLASQGINIGANYNTEFWPVSEYSGNEDSVASYVDNNGILPYAVNKKEITKDKFFSNAYHEIGAGLSKSYRTDLAIKYAAKTDIFYKNGKRTIITDEGKSKDVDRFDVIVADEELTVAEKITNIVENGGSVYISAYRPILRTGWELGDDNYWKYVKQLRFSGVALYTKKKATDDNGVIGYDYKKAKKLDKKTEYFCLGAYWRQYDEVQHYSGWTDKWTLKADYAESSMCHNAGIARVWGNALRNFKLNGQALGMTAAQGCSTDTSFIDIRTSCDGKPIVIFVKKPTGYNETTGKVEYGAAEFAGLYNIMTDKSSTPLFGFEDIKDENNEVIFDASNVQCWEFLQNGSLLGTGNDVAFDSDNDKTYDKATMVTADGEDLGLNTGKGRPIFDDFEPRWPESGETKHEGDMRWCQDDVFGTESNAFETFWRWVNFTKPAINYQVSGGDGVWLDGYDLSPYVHLENLAAANAWKAANPGGKIYWKWDNSGNIAYAAEGEKYGLTSEYGDNLPTFEFTGQVESDNYYWHNDNIDYETVKKTINNTKIGDVWGSEVYKVGIYGFDALNHCRDEEGNLLEDEANKYLVDVYMKRTGNKFYYTDSKGNPNVEYRGQGDAVGPDDYEIASDGIPYSQKTFMQYFSATKYDHIDVYKVAAYYVYIMRFGAVDQVVKNCMFTTEDGQHWYFINYDNDTTLGVRNDAQLIFNWDFDRDTYDYSGNSYAYAGAKSVFWNNLSMDEDFMRIVRSIDAVLYSGGLLSVKTVLEYLDEKQMDTWCERLYNAQEQIKYLSTFKNNFETDKFLLFMQGTRKSHRDWWVNHRWELFDAMWSTGSYADKKIKFYEIITDASNDKPIDFLKITAASKYYFTVQKNNVTIDDGFVELKASDSASFYTKSNIAIGDPMVFVGPQKLKVLNFRPGVKYLSATLSLNEAYQVTESDGVTKRNTNWVDEAGTMVSKLLIGDGVYNSPLTNISGMNTISSLEEIDIRNCTMLTASPSVTLLPNLHRFRADNSACTVFEPASGVTLYEVSLPSVAASASGKVYVTDENGNPVQAKNDDGSLMFDENNQPVWETKTLSTILALQTLSLNNVTFLRQPVSEYPVYQGEDDKLPYNETIDEETGEITLSGAYRNADAFKYTEESKAIFNVKPTIRLGSVIFNNVTGLDTKKFVFDWKSELLNATPAISPKTCNLTLTKINWKDIKVSELIEFVYGFDINDNPVPTFTLHNFTGTVKVISEDGAESITLEEYNRIIKYFGEKVFTPGNALVITTGDNIFYQPTSDTDAKEYTFGDSALDAYCASQISSLHVTPYEIIRGDVFKAKATRFPNDGKTYKYVLSGWGYNTTLNRGYKLTITHSGADYICAEAGVRLTTDSYGNAVLTATDSGQYSNANAMFAITSVEFVDNEPVLPSSYEYDKDSNVYVMTVNRVIPVNANVTVYVDDVYTNTVSVSDEETHTIKLDLGASTNAPVESVTVDYSNAAYAANVIIDSDNYRLDGQYLFIDFRAVMPEDEINAVAQITVTFKTDQTRNSVSKDITINVIPIYASTVTLTDSHNEVIENNGEYEINRTGVHKFNVKLSALGGGTFNVPITDYELTDDTHIGEGYRNVNISELSETEDGYEFTVTISNPNNTFESFTRADLVTLNFYNKFDISKLHPVSFTVDLISAIIYPDKINLCVQDYENGDPDKYITTGASSNSADVYLVHNQGTYPAETGASYVKLIEGSSEYLYFKLIAEKTKVIDNNTNTYVEKEPTETYSINILSGIEKSGSTLIDLDEEVVAGAHGNDTLRIKIPAVKNFADTVTLSGQYKINYDVDATPGNGNEVEKTVNFSITVHYSVSAANTYTKLGSGYYLVDENSNYYELPDTLDASSESTLSIAKNANVKFIGFGHVLDGKPMFLYLRPETFYGAYDGFFPTGASSLGHISAYTYTNTLKIFDGYKNTEYWVNQYLSKASGWQNSNVKIMWEKFANNDRVNLYIPTYNELVAAIGSDTSFINQYDLVVAYLKTLDNEVYGNILSFEEIEINFRSGNLPGDSNIWTNHNDYIWLVTSSSYPTADDTFVLTSAFRLEDGEGGQQPIGQITNARTIAAMNGANVAANKKIRVLPFVKTV